MIEIYLTRHGQTMWNLEKRFQGCKNSELTTVGIKQAEALRDKLSDMDIDVIYASPIKRAYETAKIVKGTKSAQLIVDDRLKEINFGDYEGYTEEELLNEGRGTELEKIFSGEMNVRAPHGESVKEIYSRVKDFFEELVSKEDGKKVLVVTHGLALKVIISYLKNDGSFYDTVMGQASLSKVVIDNGNIKIEYLDDSEHMKKINMQKVGW